MFKDDRLISVLSGILLMAALGMIVQRSDAVLDFFQGPRAVAVADQFELAAGERHLLDVLANDRNLPERARPVAVVGPDCGTVRTSGRQLLYVAEGCTGAQGLSYRIEAPDLDEQAKVRVEIALLGEVSAPQPAEEPVADARDGEPEVHRPGAGGGGLAGLSDRAPPAPNGGGDAGADLAIDMSADSRPEREVASGPRALAGTAAVPDRASAPASVARPNAGAAPEAMAGGTDDPEAQQRTAVATPTPASRGGAAATPAPAGLFGTTERAFTQAGPDASRPAPAVPLDNLLAYAPEPAPGQPRQGNVRTERLRAIANMPEGFAASPRALSAPLIAAAQERPSRSLALVRVDRGPRGADAPSGLGESAEVGGLDASIPRANPVRISRGQDSQLALADPSAGLGDVRALGQERQLAPVSVAQPSGLSAPSGRDSSILAMQGDATAEVPEAGVSAADGDGEETSSGVAAAGAAPLPRPRGQAAEPTDPAERSDAPSDRRPVGEESAVEVAALPDAAAVCAMEPAMTVDPRPAGRTQLTVVSPCHAGSIAELRYSDLRLAIPLDETGRGEVEVLGFSDRTRAVLWFRDGREIGFDIPFVGMRNLTRVALVWDAPVVLDLHAFEFGAETGSEGHVHPGNRRSFDEIRRRGGGFLTTYSAIGGIGQNMQVYSFWRRRAGASGVIDLAIDFATRSAERRPDTCGGGPYSAPAFVVLRSHDGEMERALNRRLSAMDCGRLSGRRVLIEAAVDDVIIRGR